MDDDDDDDIHSRGSNICNIFKGVKGHFSKDVFGCGYSPHMITRPQSTVRMFIMIMMMMMLMMTMMAVVVCPLSMDTPSRGISACSSE